MGIHDRRSTDTLAAGQYAAIEVDDPFEQGEKIVVLRQLRSDPLARLHSHHQIDEAQYHAGRIYQRHWEIAEQGARAIDLSKEKVDGGVFVEPDTERRRDSAIELNTANRKLGKIGSAIVYDMLIAGISIEGIVEKHGLSGQYQIRIFSQKFRDCLDILAKLWELSNGTRPAQAAGSGDRS